MSRAGFSRLPLVAIGALVVLLASACAFKQAGYGVGAQAERATALQSAQAAQEANKPDTPGIYLALIERMQAQGLFYASLAHIDAYEKQYGASPDSTLLRADALRMTGQPEASSTVYRGLLATPLAARAYRGLGLLAGEAGDFANAGVELEHAAELAPTDAPTLSDLGYARLRDGDVAGARVPLMKAAQLDEHNAKILSNVALLFFAQGRTRDAHGLMDAQQFAPDVRDAICVDVAKVQAAERARRLAPSAQPAIPPQRRDRHDQPVTREPVRPSPTRCRLRRTRAASTRRRRSTSVSHDGEPVRSSE